MLFRRILFPKLTSQLSFLFSSTKKNKTIIDKDLQDLLQKRFIYQEKKAELQSIDPTSSSSAPSSFPLTPPLSKSSSTSSSSTSLSFNSYTSSPSPSTLLSSSRSSSLHSNSSDRPPLTPPSSYSTTSSSSDAERLTKYLSRAGVCSRREAERLILAGAVFVDGKRVQKNTLVTSKNNIKFFSKKGETLPIKLSSRLWMFHKPAGLLCTHSDPQNRPTIFQYIRSIDSSIEKSIALSPKSSAESIPSDHLISIGRLDFSSEGLILLTNDGELARVMEMPINKQERHYHVRVYGTFNQEKLEKIRKGVIIKGVQYGPFWTEIMKRQTSNTWLSVKMQSGKNREIRRVMQKFDLRVNRLKRIQYGPYKLGQLEIGKITEVPIIPQIKRLLYLNLRAKLKEKTQKQLEITSNSSHRLALGENNKKPVLSR